MLLKREIKQDKTWDKHLPDGQLGWYADFPFNLVHVHNYYFTVTISLISNCFWFDHFIQGIPDQPDQPAEPQEHGEQPQGEGGDEAIASGGLLTNSVASSSYSIIKMESIFSFYRDLG